MRLALSILSLTCAVTSGCHRNADSRDRATESAAASSPAKDAELRVKASPAGVTVRHGVLGCQFEIVIEDMEPAAANAIAVRGLPILERVEKALSVWRRDSDVSRVNSLASKQAVPVEGLLWDTLLRCEAWNRATRGAHDITIGAIIEARRLRDPIPVKPDPGRVEASEFLVGFAKLNLDKDRRTVRFSAEGMSLDFDSVSKGIAVEQLGKFLRKEGVANASVSSGGSTVLSIGPPLSKPPRIVDIVDDKGRERASVNLRDSALSTSGNWRRQVLLPADSPGHLFDPRTGRPVDPNLVSVSVVSPSAADSDAWSTAAAVLGPRDAQAYEYTTPLHVLFLTRRPDGSVALTEIQNSLYETWTLSGVPQAAVK